MLTFEPYGNPTYFALLGVALLPLMIGLLYGKRSRLYETLVSIFFLVLTFGGSKWTQGVALIIYILYEVVLTWGYAVYRRNHNSGPLF